MGGLGLGLELGLVRPILSLPAWQEILNLATEDTWLALYDMTNPNTRTLRGGTHLSAIADGLGNLPDLVNTTEITQPLFVPGYFGMLDALYADSSAVQIGVTDTLTITQPFSCMFVIGGLSGAAAHNWFWQGRTGGTEVGFSGGVSNTLKFGGSTELTLLSGSAALSAKNIIFAEFNGASSRGWVNSELVVSGSIVTNNITHSISLCGRPPGHGASTLVGRRGPFLLYSGVPNDEVRNRMFALLHRHSEIAIAA